MERTGARGDKKLTTTDNPILRTINLKKYFPIYERGILLRNKIGDIHAVEDIDLTIGKGETVGLVGESGCGKSTLGKTIMYLEEPTAGQVFFKEIDVFDAFKKKDNNRIREIRRGIQMIFQNPYTSLDPRMTIYDILSEPYEIFRNIPKNEWENRVYELLKMVNLEEYHAERYPHEFSGGQRQRICIARALAVEPELIVADEPVSSLDVSIRAQILNLLTEIQEQTRLSYLYVSHDLSSVRQITDRVSVMYLGQFVEIGETNQLFENPIHPYTQALLSAIPVPDPDYERRRIILPGEVPSAMNPPEGCRFHPRCLYAKDICSEKVPIIEEAEEGHKVACHRWREINSK
jgi:oligopeptide/dipeptide ABC transporter ATP-binding protein